MILLKYGYNIRSKYSLERMKMVWW